MKRILLIVCIVLVLVLPVFAVEPLTYDQFISAQLDAETGLYMYDGRYYDSSGYPVEMNTAPADGPQIEDNISNTEEPDMQPESSDDAADAEGELVPDADGSLSPDDVRLIHQEETSGNTQVNVFAIQTPDETGGTWIEGGSGESLTEKLFGAYTPYNAAGIASVDWAWIADVVLFAILVSCFFKIVAGVMKRV